MRKGAVQQFEIAFGDKTEEARTEKNGRELLEEILSIYKEGVKNMQEDGRVANGP